LFDMKKEISKATLFRRNISKLASFDVKNEISKLASFDHESCRFKDSRWKEK
jgi:hypothetical protein